MSNIFKHYLEIGGIPIINSEATENYVANMAPRIPFNPTYQGDRIHVALEDKPYRSPLIDDAPWANPNDLASDDFYGLTPLSIQGIGDSTLSATTVEHIDNGGSVNSGRHASRTVKVSAMLVAGNVRAAQLGLTWLRAVVPEDDCDGYDCGTGQLSYFLAEPNVAEHSWGEEVGTATRSFGPQKAGRVGYRWPESEVPVAMPARARWELVANEGTTIRFGASARFAVSDYEAHGPVQPYRANYLPNPTVRADLSGVNLVGASSAWFPSGGADGGSYGRVQYGVPPVGRPYGSGRYGLGKYGIFLGSGEIEGASLTSTSVMDVPAGKVSASIALRGMDTQPVKVSVIDESGSEIGALVTRITDDWVRYSVTGTSGGGVLRLIVSSPLSFSFDQMLLEASASVLPYFDGGVPSGPEYVTSWEGTPDGSRSIQRWTGTAEICRDDSDFRPFIEIVEGSLSNLSLTWQIRNEIPMSEVLEPYFRTYYQVACIQGPQVIQEFGNDDIGYFIQVEMLFVAGNPFAYSSPRAIPASPVLTATHTDVAPVARDDSWLVDPDCTPVTTPPRAPIIFDDCIETISVWQRYHFLIPAERVADWASSIPTLRFDSKGQPIKQVRVRFHPNPFGYEPQRVDPASFCSEFSISFLPPSTRLEINGVTRRAVASKTGKATVSANHLLYGTGGAPITWPELTCGVGYVLTIDVPPSQSIDLFDLGLELQRRE